MSYFQSFCNALNCEECNQLADKVNNNEMEKKKFFEKVLEKHGQNKVKKAHEQALKTSKYEAEADTAGATSVQVSKTKSGLEGQSCSTCEDSTPKQLEEAKTNKNQWQNAKTEVEKVCKGCVATLTLGLATVLESWYTDENKKKIQEIERQIEQGETHIERGLADILKIEGGWDGLDRVLGDFNKTIDKALELAVNESPELKKKVEESQKKNG